MAQIFPRLPCRYTWRARRLSAIASTLLLVAALTILACGPKNGGVPPTGSTPTPVECAGTGLAAVDLSGVCRATPQATMGALEAVS